jgi:hypothetical protein
MAKQKPVKPQPAPQVKKQTPKQGDGGAFSWLWRNAVIVIVLLFIAFIFNNMFEKQRRLNQLTETFYRLRASNPQSSELRSVYDEIMQLQPEVIGDTGYVSRLLRGYNWAIHDLAFGSLDNIEQLKEEFSRTHDDSTPKSLLEAKLRRKVGLYPFFEYIRKTTPKDAVIYIPAGDSAMWNNSKWNFIYEPEWMEYFLYPRLCLTIGSDSLHPDLAKKATHVLIVEGKGYEKLKYDVPVEQRMQEAVLPIERPDAPNQNIKP